MPAEFILTRREMIALERQALLAECLHGNGHDADQRYRDSVLARKAIEKIRHLAPKGRKVNLHSYRIKPYVPKY